jgi:hypothetical protein
MTDEGSSTFAIENIKGTVFNFTLPTVEATYKIDFTNATGTFQFEITRGIYTIPITLTNVSQKDNISLSQSINDQIQLNITVPGYQYIRAYYNSNYIVIYDFKPESSTAATIALVLVSGDAVITTRTDRIISHTILGWGYYNNNLVLISCSSTSNDEDPINTEGFIWDIEYDNQTNEVVLSQIDGINLNPDTTLKYAGKLNLSRQHAISKHLKCRFENISITRVVWTDWNNNLRTCNVLDPQIWATPESLLSYIPQSFGQKPVVKLVVSGGTLPTGKYQYFYQLYSAQGAKSTFSPLSNLITLFPGSLSDYTTPGVATGTNSQKSVSINIQNIDTNYDSIRTGYIVYQLADFPEAFYFDERAVPDTGNLTIVHNGNENDIPLDSTEVANLNRTPEVFKTIDVARNRLFAANAITKYFDLTDQFDSRAYRYNSSFISNLYNNDDTYGNASVVIDSYFGTISINGDPAVPLDYALIPETFDCINSFNKENNDITTNPFSNGDWATNSQFKYDALGTTIGGTGPNISYEFCTVDQVAKVGSSWSQHTPYINPAINFSSPEENGLIFSDTYTYPGGSGSALDTMKSPYLETLFTGYSRGEVYRWGIVFYDIYGYPSYPLWIGDIKFPFASDQNGDFGLTRLGDFDAQGNNVRVIQMGIRFSLDTNTDQFKSIKDKISGYSYVRLRRDLVDSTRLGTGYIQPTYYNDMSTFAGLIPFYNEVSLPLENRWIYDASRCIEAVQTFTSPNLLSRSVGSFGELDYLRFIGRTNTYGSRVQYATNITIPDFGINSAYYIASGDFNYTYSDESYTAFADWTAADRKFPLLDRLYVAYSSNKNSIPTSTLVTDASFPEFINMSSKLDADYNLRAFGEWGAETELLSFDSGNSNFGNIPHPDTHLIYETSPFTGGMWLPMYLASYERFLTEQYKGWTRADRYANEYILANHFMPINGITSVSTYKNDVYGGDTYVNYFDWQRTNVNYLAGSGWEPAPDDGNNIAVAIFYPAEVRYNTELNIQTQHASVRETTNTVTQGNYQYNYAYSQQNTSNVFIAKAYLQSSIVREPHTIYPSEPKLDGEQLDSWRSLLVNNALSVNGNYGEINRVIQFKDKLFYYQNDGVGIAAVDERVLANEGDTTQTQLGTGSVLQRFDYVSTETGCKHSFAVESTGSSIYHYDSFINKLFKYAVGKTKDEISGMNPLTDVKGLSGFFRTAFVGSTLKSEDKILRSDNRVGIVSSFNSEYNTVYFTFFDQASSIEHTISYNELLDAFESFYDFHPSMYINMRKRFLSIAPTGSYTNVYTHNIGSRNTFYTTYYPSSITFRVNENSDFVKTFDNFQVNTEVILNNLQLAETISTMTITNDYQNVSQPFVNFTQKIRSWRLAIPRDETNPALTIKPRISDKYMDVTFTHDAKLKAPIDVNKVFRLHDVITEYSMRSKIVPK